MLNLTNKRKNRYLKEQKNEIAQRLVGKSRLTDEEREAIKEKKMKSLSKTFEQKEQALNNNEK